MDYTNAKRPVIADVEVMEHFAMRINRTVEHTKGSKLHDIELLTQV